MERKTRKEKSMVVSPSLRPRRKVLQLLLLVAALCQWAGAALVQGSQCDALNNTFWPPQGGAVTTYVKIGVGVLQFRRGVALSVALLQGAGGEVRGPVGF